MSVRLLKNGAWQIDISMGRKNRVRYSIQTQEIEAVIFEGYVKKYLQLGQNIEDIYKEFTKSAESINKVFKYMLIKIKSRAQRKNIPFELTNEDLILLIKRTHNACSLTGVTLDFVNGKHKQWNPYLPSIDRINPSAGYTLNNVRLVCLAVNIAINTWGLDVYDDLVRKRYERLG